MSCNSFIQKSEDEQQVVVATIPLKRPYHRKRVRTGIIIKICSLVPLLLSADRVIIVRRTYVLG